MDADVFFQIAILPPSPLPLSTSYRDPLRVVAFLRVRFINDLTYIYIYICMYCILQYICTDAQHYVDAPFF